jgi:peptide/nickel transport system substrate-binding protein
VRLLFALALGAGLVAPQTSLAQKPHAAATPKRGGSLTIRLYAAPSCLDTYKSTGTELYAEYPVLDTLVTESDKGKIVPYLAQSYKVSKNGLNITFHLRPNLKFSDGMPVTAAAVKADLERVLDPATKSAVSKGYLGAVSSIDTSGKYIVTLHFSAPNRAVLTYLATTYLGIMDPASVAAAGSNTCNGLVGSGAYKVTEVGPAYATIKEVRNPLHTFGPGWAHNHGPGYLNSITFVPIVSNTTAVSELLSGQLDVTDVAGTELGRVKGNRKFTLHNVFTQNEVEVAFNTTSPPFDHVAVRRAVAQAINRTAVLNAAVQGIGKVSTSFLPPSDFGYDPGSAKYAPKLNLSAARAAIAAAHATGPYTLLTYAGGGLDVAAELIQGELAQVGMQVNVVTKTVADWFAQLQKGNYDLAMVSHGSFDPDSLYRYFHSSQRGALNFVNANDPALDKVVLDGRVTSNLKRAEADYLTAQKIVDTNVYIDPLFVPSTIYAVRNRVQGWHTTPLLGQIEYQDLWVK